MKNLSLVLNAVLFIAVGYLYFVHFSTSDNKNTKSKAAIKVTHQADSINGATIAYVDLDSLNEKINFIKTTRKSLEAEQKSIETEWENAYRNLESQKDNFLNRGKSITQAEAEQFQASLLQQQQVVDERKQTRIQELNDKSYKFLDGIQKKLKDFLAEYNQDSKFTYIFSTGNGLDYMVYKDSALNITDDVIKGMNEMLNAKQDASKK
jgi:outer membrane protein